MRLDGFGLFVDDMDKMIHFYRDVLGFEIKEGEVPVFWCCGVTPQSVVMNSKPSFCITHSPGHMLITDITNASLID